MKSNAMPDGFPVSREDWDKLIAKAPEHIDDPECPYDPNDPASVEEYWKDAVETGGGGPEAVRAALDERRRTRGAQKVPAKVSTTIRLSLALLPGLAEVSPWREQASFAQVIARGCWPLHPMAVWLLTRQSNLIQQRSALAFVKQATTELASVEAVRGGRPCQVSAAELLHDYMLEQFAAGNRVPGGAVESWCICWISTARAWIGQCSWC